MLPRQPPDQLDRQIGQQERQARHLVPGVHRDQDRLRTEVAARDQCKLPYRIDRSPDGNILMLGHDNPQRQEMVLKGSVEGKTFVGPGPSPAGADDREVVSFDGQVLILKWVDPEIAGRYGIMVLARCSPEEMPLTVRPKSGDGRG